MEAQEEVTPEKEAQAHEVMESVGEDSHAGEPVDGEAQELITDGDKESAKEDLPLYAKERIGKMQKRHHRDMRRLQERINMLENQSLDNTGSQMNPNPQMSADNGGVDEQIQRAVSMALQAKEQQERQTKQQQEQQHIAREYQNLQQKLDHAADKYDDFQEVVMGSDVPYTPHMRDAMLMIDNPGDVLYKLGKNRPELERIAKLHPLDQAKEMLKLSVALQSGEKSSQSAPKTLGQVKSSPAVNSRNVTEKTSPSEIRRLMKTGAFK